MPGPVQLVAWLGGHDLAGSGSLIEIADPLTGLVRPSTVLGPQGAFESEAPLGRVMYSLSETGFLAERQMSLRNLLGSGAPDYPWRSVIGHFGAGLGAPCTIATDMRIKSDSIPPDIADFTKVSIEYFCDTLCRVYRDSRFMAGGSRVTDTAPGAPYTGYRLDGGAASTTDAHLCIMIDPDVRWRGAESVTAKLRHSASAGSTGWTDVSGGSVTLTPTGDAVQLYATLTGTLRRYVAIAWSWGSQSHFEIDNASGYAPGATTVHLDTRSAVQTLVPGDHFRLGGANLVHTVTSGGFYPGDGLTEADVTFTPATSQTKADGDGVTTVSRTDRGFKLLAALHR